MFVGFVVGKNVLKKISLLATEHISPRFQERSNDQAQDTEVRSAGDGESGVQVGVTGRSKPGRLTFVTLTGKIE